MANAKNLKIDTTNLNILLFGKTGSGKTHFTTTAPTPALLLDLEDTNISHRGHDVDYFVPSGDKAGWDMIQNIVNNLLENKPLEEGMEVRKYKTVIVDNLSALNKLAQASVFTHDKDGKPTYDERKTMILWGQVNEKVLNFLHKLRQIDAHLISTAHLRMLEDSSTGIVSEVPHFTGQLRNDIPKYFGEIYYCEAISEGKGEKATTQYRMQTKADKKNAARSRLDKDGKILPMYVLDNSWGEIMGYFERGEDLEK